MNTADTLIFLLGLSLGSTVTLITCTIVYSRSTKLIARAAYQQGRKDACPPES